MMVLNHGMPLHIVVAEWVLANQRNEVAIETVNLIETRQRAKLRIEQIQQIEPTGPLSKLAKRKLLQYHQENLEAAERLLEFVKNPTITVGWIDHS